MDEVGFHERLIIAEEEARTVTVSPSDDDASQPTRPETIVIQRESFTTASSFHIREPGRQLPLAGPGTLVQVLVIADSTQFNAHLELDGQVMISDAFADIRDRSSELVRIDAYQRADGDYVFTAEGYEFQDTIDAVISPQESITFTLQRAEFDVIRSD